MGQNEVMPRGTKPPTGPLSIAVADILRAKAARMKVSHAQIATSVGRSRQQIDAILSGAKHVDIELLDEIAYSLNYPTLIEVVEEAERDTADRRLLSTWRARPLA